MIFYIPVATENRKSLKELELTEIGEFGRIRKERPGIPAHFHTGIDIKRTGNNYEHELIFPIAEGKVISKRDDGPFAQLIIEHYSNSEKSFWSVYEHIAGIKVNVGDKVSPYNSVARFMNLEELNKYGWQFNHFHLEILKVAPIPRNPTQEQNQLLFKTYGLYCFSEEELLERYYNPIDFLNDKSEYN